MFIRDIKSVNQESTNINDNYYELPKNIETVTAELTSEMLDEIRTAKEDMEKSGNFNRKIAWWSISIAGLSLVVAIISLIVTLYGA